MSAVKIDEARKQFAISTRLMAMRVFKRHVMQ